MSESLEPELLAFIDDVVDSVELIEVLAMLAADSSRWFDTADVTQSLKTSERSARQRLERLHTHGLTQMQGGQYRYAPASESSAELVTTLLRAYRTHRLRVIDAVFNRRSK
jgi:hypothetical protein